MNIHDELIVMLDELGVVTGEKGEFIDMDSITFITMVIRIEETFGISFPDDLLNSSAINTISNLETIIINVLSDGE